MSATKLIIELGPLCDPLSVQLRTTRLGKEAIARLDRNASSLSDLYVHGLLSPAEHTRVGKRLIKRIQNGINLTKTLPKE